MRHRSSGSQPLVLPFGRRFFHLKGDSVGNCVIRWCKIRLDRLVHRRGKACCKVAIRRASWKSRDGRAPLATKRQNCSVIITGWEGATARQFPTTWICGRGWYRVRARTTCTSRREVIHYERIRRKGRVTFFHVTLRSRENEVWKFIKHAWTRLIPNWTEINNRQDVIVRVKIGGKCRRTFFHQKNPLFLRKINATAYYTRILGQFLVRHVRTPSSWKRKLRTRVFPLLHTSCSVFIFPLFSNFLPSFLSSYFF